MRVNIPSHSALLNPATLDEEIKHEIEEMRRWKEEVKKQNPLHEGDTRQKHLALYMPLAYEHVEASQRNAPECSQHSFAPAVRGFFKALRFVGVLLSSGAPGSGLGQLWSSCYPGLRSPKGLIPALVHAASQSAASFSSLLKKPPTYLSLPVSLSLSSPTLFPSRSHPSVLISLSDAC